MVKTINNEYRVIEIEMNGALGVFTTAYNNFDLHRSGENFNKNIEVLKRHYGLLDIKTLHQIHSSDIFDEREEKENGDGLYTLRKNIAVGVFTADCVPVLIYDLEKKAAAAVHSGWKGTLNGITAGGVKKLVKMGSEPKNIRIIIGPHNKKCCYEIGEDVRSQFKKNVLFQDRNDIFWERNLDMERAIIISAESAGVKPENITTLDYCTFCSKNEHFHSYRRDGKNSGRMLSFIFMK